MKRKLWVKILSTILSITLIFQVGVIGSLAIPKEVSDQSEITTLSLTDSDKEMIQEIKNLLLRYILFAYLYNSGELYRVENGKMLSIKGKEGPDGSSLLTAEFFEKNLIVRCNTTVTIMLGDGAYWKNAITNKEHALSKLSSVVGIIGGTIAFGKTEGSDEARNIINDSISSYLSAKDLEKK